MSTTELHAQLQHLSEQLAEYRAAVGDAVQVLGHTGDQPVDLRDALGQIERLVAGHDLESTDLSGLAEDIRAALYDRARARQLLAGAVAQCERRTQERDAALARLASGEGSGAV